MDGWAHTGLKVAELAPGHSIQLDAAAEERIVVPLSGVSFTVSVDGQEHVLAGRASVFDNGPSDVLYTGINKAITITAEHGGRVAPPASCQAVISDAADQGRGHPGGEPAARTARAKSTISAPRRHWKPTGSSSAKSSPRLATVLYPPHKHDEEKRARPVRRRSTTSRPSWPAIRQPRRTPDPIGYARVTPRTSVLSTLMQRFAPAMWRGSLWATRTGHGSAKCLRPLLPERDGWTGSGARLAHQR